MNNRYYAIKVYKYPDIPAYDNLAGCKGDVYVGKRGRFCGQGKEKQYLNLAEAQLWIDSFLKKRPNAQEYEFGIIKIEKLF